MDGVNLFRIDSIHFYFASFGNFARFYKGLARFSTSFAHFQVRFARFQPTLHVLPFSVIDNLFRLTASALSV
jgi:hypothetical protein